MPRDILACRNDESDGRSFGMILLSECHVAIVVVRPTRGNVECG